VRSEAPVAVQFSGHSHGGQVRIPSAIPDGVGLHTRAPVLPRFGKRYPIGLYRVGQRQVYTNRGLGVWPLPFRFNCRPEITVFTLRADAGVELGLNPGLEAILLLYGLRRGILRRAVGWPGKIWHFV